MSYSSRTKSEFLKYKLVAETILLKTLFVQGEYKILLYTKNLRNQVEIKKNKFVPCTNHSQ